MISLVVGERHTTSIGHRSTSIDPMFERVDGARADPVLDHPTERVLAVVATASRDRAMRKWEGLNSRQDARRTTLDRC